MAPSGPALAVALRANVGASGYVLLILLNLGFGLCCAWMLDAAGAVVYARVRHKSEAVQEWAAGAGHAAGLILFFFEIYLGGCLSTAVLPLIH